MTDGTTTVFAVDDDPSVRKGIERLLRSAGFKAEMFASAEAFLNAYRHDAAGCLILDLALPGLDGLQLQQRLLERGGVLPIIFLSGHGDVATSVRAMKHGAADFFTKPVDDDELLAAVHKSVQRCERLRCDMRELAVITQRLATLTPREREVLAHLLTGKLNKQIAACLGTGEKTIKVHRARVMHKMQAPTFAALVRLADRAGVACATATVPAVAAQRVS